MVGDQWREPDDYLEPLAGVPHQKLRVGPFRVGCRLSRDEMVLWVLTIKKRGVTPTGATTNVVSHRLLIRDVSWDDDLLVRKPRNSIYGLTDTLCF